MFFQKDTNFKKPEERSKPIKQPCIKVIILNDIKTLIDKLFYV